MNVLVILLLAALILFVVGSLFLGRVTHEVQNVRDEEHVELEGTWIRYRITGQGPPVLLVHGLLSSSCIWERLAERLSRRFTVYSLDLAGFGESDKPLSGYGVRHGSRLLYTFCAHFELGRLPLVGHDIGGAMAVKLAMDHPDTVERLVLVGTPADEEQIDLPTPLWLATIPVIGPVFYSLGQYVRPVRQLWLRSFVSETEHLSEQIIEDAGRSVPAAVRASYGVSRREIGRGRLPRQARGLTKPLLVVYGEEDQIVDPRSSGTWARAVPQAEAVLIEGCGHLPMVERPKEFEDQVLTFLTADSEYLEGSAGKRAVAEEGAGLPDDGVAAGETEASADLRYVQPEGVAYPEESLAEEAPGDHREQTPHPRPADDEAPRVHKRKSSGRSYGSRGEGRNSEGRRRAAEGSRSAGSVDPSENLIPELPDNLFDWPERWQEPRHRKGPDAGNSGEIGGEDRDYPEDARP